MQRDRPSAVRTDDVDAGIVDQERRRHLRRRRRVREVSAERGHRPHLHRSEDPGGIDDRGRSRRQNGVELDRADRRERADADHVTRPLDATQIVEATQVDEPLRLDAPEPPVDHEIGAACDRHGATGARLEEVDGVRDVDGDAHVGHVRRARRHAGSGRRATARRPGSSAGPSTVASGTHEDGCRPRGNRVRDGSRRGDEACLPDALGTERPVGIDRLDQFDVDAGGVDSSGHAVVVEVRREHSAVARGELLGHREADPHHGPALDLTLARHRVDRPTDVVRGPGSSTLTMPVSGSTSTSATHAPNPYAAEMLPGTARPDPGSAGRRTRSSSRRCRLRGAAGAGARGRVELHGLVVDRGDDAVRSTSASAGTASTSDAASSSLSWACDAAPRAALPATNVVRLACTPTSHGFTSVSELTTAMFSSGTPISSATIIARAVSEPCPSSDAPVMSVTRPSRRALPSRRSRPTGRSEPRRRRG